MDDLPGFRRRLGVSLMDFKRAVSLCEERPEYAEDFLMALAWVDASGLAISVKGDRAAWNDRSAAARIDGMFSHVDFEAQTPVSARLPDGVQAGAVAATREAAPMSVKPSFATTCRRPSSSTTSPTAVLRRP